MFGRGVFEVTEVKGGCMVKEQDFEAEKNQINVKNPKSIFNDQVGSGPFAHTKFSSATRSKVSRGQKMSRKTDFQ